MVGILLADKVTEVGYMLSKLNIIIFNENLSLFYGRKLISNTWHISKKHDKEVMIIILL